MCVEDVKKLPKDFPFQIEKYKEKSYGCNVDLQFLWKI